MSAGRRVGSGAYPGSTGVHLLRFVLVRRFVPVLQFVLVRAAASLPALDGPDASIGPPRCLTPVAGQGSQVAANT